MANINQTFQAQSNSIATYPYTDIAEGTGRTTFYGIAVRTSSGVDYILSTNPSIYASDVETTHEGASGGLDVDFDLSAFNKPQTIMGTAYVNVGFAVTTGSGGGAQTGVITATVKKYDGTTETTIGTGVSQTLTSGAGDGDADKSILCIPISLTQTHFARGDILRLTLSTTDGGTDFKHTIGHDPQNRDGTYLLPSSDDPVTTTKLIFDCPFRLDEIGQ